VTLAPERPILVVEDNEDDIALTFRALRHNNILHGIELARDGAEALELLLDEDDDHPLPLVVLLDLNLPRMSGLDVLREIRAHERTRLLPVVVLSSSRDQTDIVESYALGANSYVRKPVDFAAFTAAVRELGAYWLRLNENPPEEHP
jgi:two-component system, response regulator